MRDGRAVPSRIKVEVAFKAPVSVPVPVPVPDPSLAPSRPPPITEEVTVHGIRPAPGSTSLGRAEVRQLPRRLRRPLSRSRRAPRRHAHRLRAPLLLRSRRAAPATSATSSTASASPICFTSAPARRSSTPAWWRASASFRAAIPRATAASPAASSPPTPPRRAAISTARATSACSDSRGARRRRLRRRQRHRARRRPLLVYGRHPLAHRGDTTLDYRDYEARASLSGHARRSREHAHVRLLRSRRADPGRHRQRALRLRVLPARRPLGITASDRRRTLRVAVTGGFDQTRIPGQPRNSRDTGGRHALRAHARLLRSPALSLGRRRDARSLHRRSAALLRPRRSRHEALQRALSAPATT